jgi:hypothetical protein
MNQKSTLEAKALGSQKDEDKQRVVVIDMRAVAAGQPSPYRGDKNVAMILMAMFGVGSVREFVDLVLSDAEDGVENPGSMYLEFLLLDSQSLARRLHRAINAAIAARKAGFDIDIALRDLDTRSA